MTTMKITCINLACNPLNNPIKPSSILVSYMICNAFTFSFLIPFSIIETTSISPPSVFINITLLLVFTLLFTNDSKVSPGCEMILDIIAATTADNVVIRYLYCNASDELKPNNRILTLEVNVLL